MRDIQARCSAGKPSNKTSPNTSGGYNRKPHPMPAIGAVRVKSRREMSRQNPKCPYPDGHMQHAVVVLVPLTLDDLLHLGSAPPWIVNGISPPSPAPHWRPGPPDPAGPSVRPWARSGDPRAATVRQSPHVLRDESDAGAPRKGQSLAPPRVWHSLRGQQPTPAPIEYQQPSSRKIWAYSSPPASPEHHPPATCPVRSTFL